MGKNSKNSNAAPEDYFKGGGDIVERILSSIKDAFATLDKDLRFVYVNEMAVEMSLGKKSKADFLGKLWTDVFPEAVGTAFHDALRRVIEMGEPEQFEYFYPVWNRWFESRMYPTDDGGVSFFSSDITEKKSAESSLAETINLLEVERERLNLALRTGALGAYEWRVDEDSLWWSPEIYPVFGVQPEKFTPTIEAFNALIHPEDREELWHKTDECIRRREVFTHEYRIVRHDGEIRWIFNR